MTIEKVSEMKSGYSAHYNESARLTLLKELLVMPGYASNEVILTAALDDHGYRGSREWVRTQIFKIGELGAAHVDEQGSVLVVTLLSSGQDHVEGRVRIDGIAVPRPGL